MLNKPFHLSFTVSDKDKAKEFYAGVLGCAIGRDTETWFDILFFGHQVTIHQESEHQKAHPIDHFGPILSKDDWFMVSDKLKIRNYPFVMEPSIKNPGMHNESGKFIVNDSCGNLLEFKYYLNFEGSVGTEVC